MPSKWRKAPTIIINGAIPETLHEWLEAQVVSQRAHGHMTSKSGSLVALLAQAQHRATAARTRPQENNDAKMP
jgi:hypothetical protein